MHALDRLAEWAAEARVEDAVDHRRRAAWLRRQMAEEATLSGVLTDLAEHGRAVVIQLSTGARHRGRITRVGRDVVGLATGDGRLRLVRLGAVVAVRPQPGAVPVAGVGGLDAPTSLHRELSRIHQDLERVSITVDGGDAVIGVVDSLGHDVITVAADGGGQVYLPLYSVVEVSVPESG